MSGSNSICLTTVLLETGMLPIDQPETVVRIDTASGLVTARATCRNGKCERVTLTMNPSYVDRLDAVVEVEGFGKVTLDIAYGGIFYALIDPAQLGLGMPPIRPSASSKPAAPSTAPSTPSSKIAHPEIAAIKGISYTMFVGHNAEGQLKGATIMPPGRIDRSPCGTGNSARLAVAAARGLARPGDSFTARSIINSTFEVTYAHDTTVAGRPAVQPIISGRGWIHGIQVGLDPPTPTPSAIRSPTPGAMPST